MPSWDKSMGFMEISKLGWPLIRTIICTFIRGFQIINYISENSGGTHHDFLSLNTKVNNAFGGGTAYLTAIVTTFTTPLQSSVHGNPDFEPEQPVHNKPALFGFWKLHFISWSLYFGACSLSVMIAVMLPFSSLKKPNLSNSNNCHNCFHVLIRRYTRSIWK